MRAVLASLALLAALPAAAIEVQVVDRLRVDGGAVFNATVTVASGLTASSGTFTASGPAQFSVLAASGIKVEAGPVSAPFFLGNGSALTGITASQVAASGVQAGTLGASVIASSVAAAAVDTVQLKDASVTAAKLNQNGCAANQVLKWNGAAWACAADESTDSSKVTKAGDFMSGQLTLAGPSSMTVTGVVGIGAVGLAAGTLAVRSTSTTAGNPVLNLQDNAGIEIMRVQQDGKVGIGTTSPARLLTVNGGANPSRLLLQTDASGSTIADGFDIAIQPNNEAYVWNYENNPMLFGTNNAERMRIDSTGNVGIGTRAPVVPLTVYKAAAPSISVKDVNSGWFGLNLGIPSTSNGELWNYDDGYLRFGTNNAERIRIDGIGNVGIGTTTPQARFHLRGSSIFDSPSGAIRILETADTLGVNDLGLWRRAANIFALADWQTGTRGAFIDTANGNVGIRAENPQSTLHVSGTGRFEGGDFLRINSAAPSDQKVWRQYVDGSSWYLATQPDDFSTENIFFRAYRVGTAIEKIVISNNVGIGLTNPQYKLEVAGWIAANCAKPGDSSDAMVALGPWCVDKYEASAWSTNTGGTQYGSASDDYPCNDNGQDCGANAAFPIYARSVSGVTPSRYLTWFQANIACVNAGKELLPNSVWQAAAAGTPDPGSTGTAPNCNVSGTGPTTTGGGTSCLSTWGAENMIGSLWEWVADWGQYGMFYTTTDPNNWADETSVNTQWPDAGYGSDGSWNVAGRSHNGAGWVQGLPGAVIRGGGWGDGANAGVFAFAASSGPSFWAASVGFRCGRRR